MPEFYIEWRIELDADNQTEAARKALAIQRDPTSAATVFHVSEADNGEEAAIDLTALDELAQSFKKEEETPAEPKTLTREEAIDQLIEERLSNWDSDDIDEALRTGRYGYAEFSNAVLEALWNDFFDEVVTITGQEPAPTVEVKKAEHDKQAETFKQMLDALKLLQAVKGPVTFDDGWATLEDGTEICMNDLIAQAEGNEV